MASAGSTGENADEYRDPHEEAGVGLGFAGLAAPALAARDMIIPPLNFAMVSQGIYRGGYPVMCNFPFLQQLHLRSILCLCPESLRQGSREWANSADVKLELCELGENSPPFVGMALATVQKAVAFLMDERNKPVLVHCLTGKTQTGCVVGCLRRRQNWSLSAIFDEYTRFAGSMAKPLDMQFIEFFE